MRFEYLTRFLEEYDYPLGAKETLTNTYERVRSGAFFDYVAAYAKGELTYDEGMERMRELAQETGIHEYTLILLYLIYIADTLKEQYIARGMELSVWRDSMLDLKSKALDCEGLYGFWGTKEAVWHKAFFEFVRFGFEKLQFNTHRFGKEYHKNGLHLTKDDVILRVHIPRTGEKLDYEGVQRAYKKAMAFFRKYFPDTFAGRPVVFVLKSWMLFEKLKDVLPPQSNFMKFCNDYDVFDEDPYEDYSSVWRVFYKPYDGDLSKMAQETRLQRAYAEWIAKGEKIGGAWGVYYPMQE